MKTLLGAVALAALVTLGGSAVEKWAGYGAQAQSCDQICSHSQSGPQEQCVKRCRSIRSNNPSFRPSGTRVYGYTGPAGGSCGQYNYIKAGRCVDARLDPPKLN